MATTIVNPSGQSNIDNAFSNIFSMFNPNTSGSGGSSGSTNLFGTGSGSNNLFGTSSSGGGSGTYGISSLQNPDNSLTGLWYNLANLAGPESQQLFGAGTNLVNAGANLVNQGNTDIAAPTAYYQQLLNGNPSTVTAALAPTAANINTITSGAINNASQGMPLGGYRASTLANLPFAQASQVGNAALGLQQTAAQQLASIGAGQEQAGVNQQQVGTTLTGQSLQQLQSLIADSIQKMQINYANSGINQAIGLLGAIGSAAAPAASAYKTYMGCWIAEAIYGEHDTRTHLVRAYLNGPFRQTWRGRVVMALYARFGRAIAAMVRRSSQLKRMFQPLFDRALSSALEYIGDSI